MAIDDLLAANANLQASTAPARVSKDFASAVAKWAQSVEARLAGQALTPAPPKPPITTLASVTFGAHVYQAPAVLSDYLVDGTTDSAVLIEPSGKGSKLSRFHITRAASLGAGPGWARHGVYAKALNVTLEDFHVECDPGAPHMGQVFSVRDAGFTCRRFYASGLLLVGIFEDSAAVGTVLFEDGTGKAGHPDTCVWIDTPLLMAVTFRRCAFSGLGLFVRASSVYPGTVTLEGCTLNGKPCTAASAFVPSGRVVIA